MRYHVIQQYDRRYPIRLMCRALAVSPAGYYAWRGRPESARSAANRALLTDIQHLHRESRQTYGSPRIWGALRAQGHQVGEHRVARLMRHHGLRAKTVPKWRTTTQSTHPFPVASNQLNRQFAVAAPNQVWARRPHVYLDGRRLALSGGSAGSLFTGRDWVGHGQSAHGGVDAAGVSDGAEPTSSETRAAPSFRSRQSVCSHSLPTAPAGRGHDREHVASRKLLGQRLR